MAQYRALPDSKHSAGDDGCGPVTVHVVTHGGRGGDPVYAGGHITGHVGSLYSLLSQEQMRRLAAALLAAADKIAESELPSFQELRARKQGGSR